MTKIVHGLRNHLNGRRKLVLWSILKEFLVKKKLSLSILGTGALLLLSACGHGDVTSQSSGVWERLILTFGKAIQGRISEAIPASTRQRPAGYGQT